MAWYWWVLIVIGVIVIGWLKLKVWGNLVAKRKQDTPPADDEE